ncbi:hypothetical protein [Microbulbifer taiwanensis]|uniref:Uncharacterized protein n=2 Tax=Microbulbifer taiwanensis TaxID=986746 RepID=A0ABW1YV72_9GAMM|nr:hypothetical protein [Microbulbifer taiwanensis]
MAQRLVGLKDIAWLSLDELYWDNKANGKYLVDSLSALYEFAEWNENWVIEGCQCDLVQAAMGFCEELRFMNPGCEACVSRCINKPRNNKHRDETSKEETPLDRIIASVGQYEYRRDGFGLDKHKALFDSFVGAKKEYTVVI